MEWRRWLEYVADSSLSTTGRLHESLEPTGRKAGQGGTSAVRHGAQVPIAELTLRGAGRTLKMRRLARAPLRFR